MKGIFLPMAVSFLLLASCMPQREAIAIRKEEGVTLMVWQGDVLNIIDIPQRVEENHLLPVKPKSVYNATKSGTRKLELLLSALRRECGVEDGWEALGRIRSEAKGSDLPKTLGELVGYPGLWKKMTKAKRWNHFDLGKILPDTIDWQKTDQWLSAWFEEALSLGQRRE